jgi:hypothetical protein
MQNRAKRANIWTDVFHFSIVVICLKPNIYRPTTLIFTVKLLNFSVVDDFLFHRGYTLSGY